MDFLNEFEIDYFWSFVEKGESCWIWKGLLFDSGYPRFNFKGVSKRAHKLAYQIAKGKVHNAMCVCHSCDNPLCVNPDHLWVGSPKQNTRDMIRKGRLIRDRSKHKDSASKYPGISFRKEKRTKPWRARIMRNYTTIWCKEFETEEEAHIERSIQLILLS